MSMILAFLLIKITLEQVPCLVNCLVIHHCVTSLQNGSNWKEGKYWKLGLAEVCLSGKEMLILVLYFALFLCCCVLVEKNKSEHQMSCEFPLDQTLGVSALTRILGLLYPEGLYSQNLRTYSSNKISHSLINVWINFIPSYQGRQQFFSEELSLSEILIYIGGIIIKSTDPNQCFVILLQEQAESSLCQEPLLKY